jgi:hypothetical protein
MQLLYFDTPEEANKAGLDYPETDFKDYAVICIVHKKKMINLLLERTKYLGLIKKNDPKDLVAILNHGIRELSRLYPELRPSKK